MSKRFLLVGLAILCLGIAAPTAQAPAASGITSPKTEFGHAFGDDYFLANYKQMEAYWRKLDRESDRMVLEDIGKTAEGRTHLMAIVTSPANHKKLSRYKEISRRLALAEGLTDDQARAMAKEGKAVVWIDGGLHATETLGAQQLGEMVYQMVSRNDEETLRILDDVIILFVHANPDGNDLVADWYMRAPDPTERSYANLPRLYQKYIGHDNNRDFFASTQPETENMNRVLYHEWFPQILYNHHQSGPAGTVLWSPPLRDPFNYNQDPLLVLGLQAIGVALHTRLAAEGKPGATMRSGGPYDGWWNGGIRNTAAFHNTIAILTEMIGNPTPMRVPLMMDRQLPTSDLTFPIAPQEWRFRQSIDYSVACNRGVLDIASRMKENFQFNRYVMGKNSIQRGSEDSWTPRPHRYAEVARTFAAGRAGGGGGGRGGSTPEADAALWAALRKPEYRDPRGYILPSDQADFPNAITFINALREVGIKVHRATSSFAVAGKTYPAGSLVVMTNQAFRPHVIDMFEPQDHPDNFPSPGAPPTPPYDNAGWTLAYQMGIEFDRILDGFTGPFVEVKEWNIAAPSGSMPAAAGGGYLLSRDVLNTFDAVNKLNADGAAGVSVTTAPLTVDGKVFPAGTFHVAESRRAKLAEVVGPLGLRPVPLGQGPAAALAPIRVPRVGLWDQYGGSMPAGWTRWILEQSNFAFTRVFAPRLDAGNLNADFDVLVFVTGAIPGTGAGGGRGGAGRGGGTAGPAPNIPAEYRDQIGSITAARTIPALRQFVENGGRIVAIGSSAANLAQHFGLPVENQLVEPGTAPGAEPQPLPRTKYYVPGSVLQARLDTTSPLALGMKERTDVFFDNSPVWKLGSDAKARGVTPIAWFDSPAPLRSGWAWGQAFLDKGVIAVDAQVGKGRVFLYGPEILMRAQPRGTFKFLFNAIYWGQQ